MDPTYRDVCSSGTGHAEVVKVGFDPDVVSYDNLLQIFWDEHNRTTLNRQGPDVGSQYRSAIFYHSPEQGAAQPIATEIETAGPFYEAEDYHQQYLEKRGLATCTVPSRDSAE